MKSKNQNQLILPNFSLHLTFTQHLIQILSGHPNVKSATTSEKFNSPYNTTIERERESPA